MILKKYIIKSIDFLNSIFFYNIILNLYRILQFIKIKLISSGITVHFFSGKLDVIRGDTCFILGTGNSINLLNYQDYELFSNNTTIAINTFILNEYQADYYLIEESSDPEINNLFIKIYSKKLKLIENINLLAIPETRAWLKKINSLPKLKLYLYSAQPFLTNLSKNIEFILSRFLLRKERNLFNNLFFTYGINSSLERAVLIALLNGFKNIVLVGVDLYDNNHFWLNDSIYLKKLGISKEELKNILSNSSNVHKTADKNYKKFTVIETLPIINRISRSMFNGVYIFNQKSKLHSAGIPLYNKLFNKN